MYPLLRHNGSDVEFNDETVKFRLINAGETQRSPGQKDGWNVVD